MAACERLQMSTAQPLCLSLALVDIERSNDDHHWTRCEVSWRDRHLRAEVLTCERWPNSVTGRCKWKNGWPDLGRTPLKASYLFHPSTIIYHSDPFGPFTSSPHHRHHHHHHHPLSNSDKRQITSKLYFNTAPWKTRDWTWLQKHQHCLLAYLDSVLTCLPFHESPCANNLRQMISLLVQWEEMAGEQAHGARQLDKNMSQEKFIAICLLAFKGGEEGAGESLIGMIGELSLDPRFCCSNYHQWNSANPHPQSK